MGFHQSVIRPLLLSIPMPITPIVYTHSLNPQSTHIVCTHTVFDCQGHDGGSTGDERLLVGEADVLASLDGGDGRGQPRAADDTSHCGIHVGVTRHLHHAFYQGYLAVA